MTVRISATEFQRNPGAWADKALYEPVILTTHGRDRLVVISIADYERFLRLDSREVFLVEDLPDDIVQGLLEAQAKDASEGHAGNYGDAKVEHF